MVVEKPVNLPVMEDSSGDEDLLSLLKKDLKARYHKPGEVYLGLVHRLDRPVGGVMVFAKTSKAASRLSRQIQNQEFEKVYQAIIMGTMEKEGTLQDYLFKNRKTNTVSVVSANHREAKKAALSYRITAVKDNLSQVEIHLKTGRSHQIRVQFASRRHPLWGDQRYNKEARPGQQIALWAKELSLNHPITKERLTFVSAVPDTYPWNQFKKEEQHAES